MMTYRGERLILTKEWPEPRPMVVPRPLKRPPETLQEALATCDVNSLAIYLRVLGCTSHQIIAAMEDPTGYGFRLITALRPTAIV